MPGLIHRQKRGMELLEPSYAVAVALQQIDDRIPSGEMASTDGDHDRARLLHALLDPLAPVGVTLLDQGLRQLGRGRQVTVEGARNAFDVAADPRGEHVVEVALDLA